MWAQCDWMGNPQANLVVVYPLVTLVSTVTSVKGQKSNSDERAVICLLGMLVLTCFYIQLTSVDHGSSSHLILCCIVF